ncbi:MAG: hypothetical protein FWG63_11895 [Defluviitaleaceae bacterium]|nr:hypothetical protein [Defluviitaleaceae bacterium]
MQTFIQNLNARFTAEEKQNCLPTAHRIIDLYLFSKVNGIIALEDEVAKDHGFLKMGIGLLLSDSDETIMESVFCNSILADGFTGEDLLNRLLISKGVIALRKGYNIFATTYTVGSLLGEKYVEKLILEIKDKVNSNLFMYEYLFDLSESESFQGILLNLTQEELYHLLPYTDTKILAEAFRGCNTPFVQQMSDSLPVVTFIEICRELAGSRLDFNKEAILNCQSKVLDNLRHLRELGLIAKE